MNNERRKQIDEALAKVAELRSSIDTLVEELEAIQNDEQEYQDNMPENLQGSEKYEKAQEAIDNLSEATSEAQNCNDYLESVEAALESAKG